MAHLGETQGLLLSNNLAYALTYWYVAAFLPYRALFHITTPGIYRSIHLQNDCIIENPFATITC